MSTNIATLIGGPCLCGTDGSSFRSKGDVKVELALETFDVAVDLYGPVDQRVANQPMKIRFTPEGRIADLSVLFPYFSAAIGSFVTPRYECGAVVAAADTIAVSATSLPAGTPVSFGTTDTMPAGLTAATVVYLGANSGGVRKVYDTAAKAITGSTDQIDLTDTGSGDLAFVVTKPLTITGNDGKTIVFHNVAVTKMPTIKFAATETLWGEVEFTAYPKNGVAWTDSAAFFTTGTAAFADSGFDPADIITQPHTLTWGAAPWAGLFTKEGITVETNLTLSDVTDDASGVVTQRIDAISVTAKAQPLGPSLAQLMTALALQGASATRGRSLAGDDLVIEGTGMYAKLTAAALVGGPAQWARNLDRIGELEWRATRTFTAGVADPLFYIGTAAP